MNFTFEHFNIFIFSQSLLDYPLSLNSILMNNLNNFNLVSIIFINYRYHLFFIDLQDFILIFN